MILERNYKLAAKGLNAQGSERKYVFETAFARDPRTGLYGLLTFKNDVMQIWSIINYEQGLEMMLNRTIDVFDGALTDVWVGGWGDDLKILATTCFSSIYIMRPNEETEQLDIKKITISNVVYARLMNDKNTIISVTVDGTVCNHTLEGQLVLQSDGTETFTPSCMAVNPAGNFIAFGDSKGCVRIFDGSRLFLISKIESFFNSITQLGFVGNNQLVVGESRGDVQLYALEDLGSESTWNKVRRYCAHECNINRVAVCSASNGERFATASDDGTVCIWDVNKEEYLHRFSFDNEAVTSLSFSPDGLHLAASTDEANTYVYTVPEHGEFNEEQYFIPYEECTNSFWMLQGFTLFDAQNLRKQMGLYNEDEESLVFIKQKLNPDVQLRELYTEFAEEMAQKQREEEEEFREIREERERQNRLLTRKMAMDKMREEAQSEGLNFEEPELDPSDEKYLQELQDLQEDGEQLVEQSLAAQAGLSDISDSDSDAAKGSDDEAVLNNGKAQGSDNESDQGEGEGQEVTEEVTNQLWATDDEEEQPEKATQDDPANRTKTEEELRKIFDECIDTTADTTALETTQVLETTEVVEEAVVETEVTEEGMATPEDPEAMPTSEIIDTDQTQHTFGPDSTPTSPLFTDASPDN